MPPENITTDFWALNMWGQDKKPSISGCISSSHQTWREIPLSLVIDEGWFGEARPPPPRSQAEFSAGAAPKPPSDFYILVQQVLETLWWRNKDSHWKPAECMFLGPSTGLGWGSRGSILKADSWVTLMPIVHRPHFKTYAAQGPHRVAAEPQGPTGDGSAHVADVARLWPEKGYF